MLLNPGELVILKFGGVNATAKIFKRSPSSVSRWASNGGIPWWLHKDILTKANDLGLDIKEKDLVNGREIRVKDYEA